VRPGSVPEVIDLVEGGVSVSAEDAATAESPCVFGVDLGRRALWISGGVGKELLGLPALNYEESLALV
jgi:hypothetical protein